MREFITHHVEFPNKKKPLFEVGIICAHHDDEKIANLEKHLAQKDVAVTRIVLTDSSARDVPTYTSDQLRSVRWQEGIVTGHRNHVKAMHRIDLPDGKLAEHIDYAVEFGMPLVEGKQALLIPNSEDMHPDHRAAHEIGLKLGGSSITVYSMDTLNGLDQDKNWLNPDLYIPLSTRTARHEKKSYLANTSQTHQIPHHQRRAMFDALGMTSRRGAEIDVAHSAVLFKTNNTTETPLEKLLLRQVNKAQGE